MPEDEESCGTTYNPKVIEERILSLWNRSRLPERIREAREGAKKFYFLDGPPTLNDVPHIGHSRIAISKDILVKFKFMQGFDVWLQPGFDCHGLPVETKVEKELGINSKSDIEKIGVDKFISACLSKILNNEGKWLDFYKQTGIWIGWFKPYFTYKNEYIESAWWTFKELHKKGLLVRGEKPVFWCWRCETTLSGYEVTDSYVDLTDPGIYVKFKTATGDYLLVYTTTPWTLPGNVAVAVHPKEDYVRAKLGNEVYILAEKRVPIIEEMIGKKFEILDVFPGEELAGMKYEPLLDVPAQRFENGHFVILSIPVMTHKKYKKHKFSERTEEEEEEEFTEFVTMDDGTGLVHTAPGHGASDYEIGRYYQLPVVSPVDERGKLTKDAGKYAGMFVKDADKEIISDLTKQNKLFFKTTIQHSYPVCWRCKSPLIYRNSSQWFLKVDPIKERMIKENEKVTWRPDHAKTRFHNWLEGSIDWCISQQRYWGIPLPIWICDKCNKVLVIGSEDELREHSDEALPEEIDLHRHVIDKVTFTCECGGTMRRVDDIANVWFDSGIAPWASFGYPYKNKGLFENLWPVDAVSEGQDQIRGWFYSLMFCGVATFDVSPYKQVRMVGWVLDEKGEKMSKSLGNVIYPESVISEYGADALRLYFASDVPYWETMKFSSLELKNRLKVLNTLWHIYEYYKIYSKEARKENLRLEDKWIISRVNSLADIVTRGLDNFELHVAGRAINNFIMNDLSRFYIKLIKERSDPAAFWTLKYVFDKLLRLLAPITPFISDYLYREMFKKDVHLEPWPEVDEIDSDLENKIEIVREILEASYAIRQERGIKLKYPLRALSVHGNEEVCRAARELSEIIKSLANVKEIEIEAKKIKYVAKVKWASIGKKFGKDAKRVAELVSREDPGKLKANLERGEVRLEGFKITAEDVYFEEVPEEGKKIEGGVVNLDTTITKELRREWFLREFARAIQAARKSAGLKIGQKIKLFTDVQLDENEKKEIEKGTDVEIVFQAPKKKTLEFEFEGKKYKFGLGN
jgi:isoleucyl-tRNA synthetase